MRMIWIGSALNAKPVVVLHNLHVSHYAVSLAREKIAIAELSGTDLGTISHIKPIMKRKGGHVAIAG
jgi:hypothetical protein